MSGAGAGAGSWNGPWFVERMDPTGTRSNELSSAMCPGRRQVSQASRCAVESSLCAFGRSTGIFRDGGRFQWIDQSLCPRCALHIGEWCCCTVLAVVGIS